jgi:hypothetical protein
MDDRQAKFTNPQILNVHGIMKSTERHTADTQITDASEYCKIEAIASYWPYNVNNYMFRFKNDCLVTIRNLLLSKSTLHLIYESFTKPAMITIVYNARILHRGVCRYAFCVRGM